MGEMIVRNRIIALLFRSAAFALLMFSFQFYWGGFSSFWTALSCFDVLLGITLIFIFGFAIVFNLIDLRHGIRGVAAYPYMPLALPLMAFSIVAGIVYFSYSLPAGGAPYGFAASIFHVCLIAIPLAEWLFFDEKGTVRFSSGFTLMIIPIFYYIFAYFRTIIWPDAPVYGDHMYAYPCLDFSTPTIVLYSFIYFILLLGSVTLVLFLNNVLAGKYRSR